MTYNVSSAMLNRTIMLMMGMMMLMMMLQHLVIMPFQWLWHVHVRNAPSLMTFRRELKTVIFWSSF